MKRHGYVLKLRRGYSGTMFSNVRIGDMVSIDVHRGAVGLEWYDNVRAIAPSAAGQPQ
jgi:hypothetical protein